MPWFIVGVAATGAFGLGAEAAECVCDLPSVELQFESLHSVICTGSVPDDLDPPESHAAARFLSASDAPLDAVCAATFDASVRIDVATTAGAGGTSDADCGAAAAGP